MYTLPIQLLGQSLTFEEELTLLAMERYPPTCHFKPGDHAMLRSPSHLMRMQRKPLPTTWEIRFVISAWAYELFARLDYASRQGRGIFDHFSLDPGEVLTQYEPGDLDGTITTLFTEHVADHFSMEGSLNEWDFYKPVIYAHGWPHGNFPDTAAWFMNPKQLTKMNLLDETQPWEPLLDEFQTPLVGFDTDAPFSLDIAPDNYAGGVSKRRPLNHEEATFHTACLLGLEEYIMVPVHPEKLLDRNGTPLLDEQHDIFV